VHLAVDDQQLPLYVQLPELLVHVAGAQRDHLAAAQTAQRDQPPQREQRIILDRLQERRHVLDLPHRDPGRAPVARHNATRSRVQATACARPPRGSRSRHAAFVETRPCRRASLNALRSTAAAPCTVLGAISLPSATSVG
jgi:hypothetical protein